MPSCYFYHIAYYTHDSTLIYLVLYIIMSLDPLRLKLFEEVFNKTHALIKSLIVKLHITFEQKSLIYVTQGIQ